ncbi:MAG: hypothetical protein NTX11_01775 [Candidatus Saccharibacteria bacterium]|nr:hypothetical protein [Candidatus Saccharibacteria bacterium]
MAKQTYKKITAVKASSIAMYEGTFASIIGLLVAIMSSLNTTVTIAKTTESTLKGLTFGIAAGIVSIIVVPFIYFGLGWIVGYLHGLVFNAVAQSSGGIELKIED